LVQEEREGNEQKTRKDKKRLINPSLKKNTPYIWKGEVYERQGKNSIQAARRGERAWEKKRKVDCSQKKILKVQKIPEGGTQEKKGLSALHRAGEKYLPLEGGVLNVRLYTIFQK